MLELRRPGIPGCAGAWSERDPFGGSENIFTTLSDKPIPRELVAELGTRFEVFNTTIKKWSVGSPLQSLLDSVTALLDLAVGLGGLDQQRPHYSWPTGPGRNELQRSTPGVTSLSQK